MTPQTSSPPPTAQQSWAPPRHPLPPHRLARLANALGVSTPMPAIHTPSPLTSPSYTGPALDPYRRSPTPSTASFNSQTTSKYLLHVIPPLSLPHDNSFDSELTPPPSTASGYHTQFRRGTLVPVHPTLQSQLAAIAKEYALPSTAGLILYLVSQSTSEKELDDEPGPRLSEDIWRHLWTRVVKSELRDELGPLGLSANRSAPYLPHHNTYPVPLLSASPQPGALHPHAHSMSAYSYPVTPSPTTPSSTSEHARGLSFGNPTSTSSSGSIDAPSPSPDGANDTPATSRTPSLDPDLPLPGLHSDALIPILAKVEFDVDRRRAGWYEPWVRSRRMNHAKRAASASRSRDNSRNAAGEGGSGDELLAFRLGKEKDRASALREEERYIPLSESPCEMDSDSEYDAEREGEVEEEGEVERPGNPHVEQLGEVDSPTDENARASIPARRRAPVPPPLVLHPSSSPAMGMGMGVPRVVPPPEEAQDSDSESASQSDDDEEVVEQPAESARLAYLDDADGEREYDLSMLSVPRKSMYDPGKRRGTVYEDMDLGFGSDIDMDDPNDRRKSQVIMRAQLDEIEKTLAQFSPRMLRSELEEQQMLNLTAASSPASPQWPPVPQPTTNADVFPPTPRLPSHPNVHPEAEEDSDSDRDDLSQQAAWPAVPYTSLAERPAANQQRFPPQLAVNGVSAAMPKRFRTPGPGSSSSGSHSTQSTSHSRTGSHSRSHSSASVAASESELRKRDLAEQLQLHVVPVAYPAMTPSIGKKGSLNSPLIPLSPDPFGRHPSQGPPMGGMGAGGGAGSNGMGMDKRTSGAYWEAPVVVPAPRAAEVQRKSSADSISGRTTGSSSRFSTDSVKGTSADAAAKQSNRTTLMSVKGIKKLWRKSNKNSVSGISTVRGGAPMESVHENAYSPLSPPLPVAPQRPNRPSTEDMDLPDVDVEVEVKVLGGAAPPRTPLTGAFPGRSGPPPPRPTQERRPSVASSHMSQASVSLGQERRPSQDQFGGGVSMPMPPPVRRPSQEQGGLPPPSPPAHQFGGHASVPVQPRRPSDAQSQMSVHSQMSAHSQASGHSTMSGHSHMSIGGGGGGGGTPMHPQLSVPPPMLRSTNSAPIIPKVGGPRQTQMDGLLWDQESPYPTSIRGSPARAPSVASSRGPSRPPSPSPMPMKSAPTKSAPTPPPSNSTPSPSNPTGPPPIPDAAAAKDNRNSVRKSILKWKSQTNGAGAGAVPAPLTPSAATFRTRKTSLSGSPSQGSPLTLPLDIPPSPKIPEQFITSYVGSHPPPPAPAPLRPNSAAIARRRQSAKMTSTSTDGGSSSRRQSRRSMASSSHSHGSEETRDTHESTSLDTSGFEIVSPRMGGTLSFPYTDLDHDRPPLVDGVRSM